MSVAVIPARGGSRRLPRKNLRLFCGVPIIVYSIVKARESGLFGRIIVSTDDYEIGDIASRHGAEVLIRSAEMSRDEVGTQAVMRFVLDQAKVSDSCACCVYPTSPLMLADDLQNGWNALMFPGHTFAMSVGTNPLRDAGQWYFGWTSAFGREPLIGPHTAMVPIPENRVCDINVESDWQRAEQMYKALHEQAS